MTSRRDFMKGVVATGGLSGLAQAQVGGPLAQFETPGAVSALPPTRLVEAMEAETPDRYTDTEARRYFVQHAASDYMVDVIRRLGIDYVAANPASSFRGLQESVINYGQGSPEWLTCLHEESSAGMAHGYAKIAYKPMAIACHGTVGLQHACMAVYNAFCDQVPMIVFAGNHLDATDRRPGAEWAHAAQDVSKLVRDFVKWDDTPVSMGHFVESMMRAYKIAMTPPMGPVVISLDGHLQEQELGDSPPPIPALPRNIPPQGDVEGLREAARMLVEAERPVLVADRMARTPQGMKRLVELAELLQAPVVDRGGRMNFPNTHYLSQSAGLVRQADLILGLEMLDFWGTIWRMRDLPHREQSRVARKDVRLIHLGVNDLFIKSNYQYFQRYQPVDLSINGDAEASLPSLTEEVRRLLTPERRSRLAPREEEFRKAHAGERARARRAAAYAWNASPVSTDRLVMEVWQQIKGRDWSLVSDHLAGLPRILWNMDRHHRYIGGSAGRGQGYGAPAAVGAALANRELGRFTVNIQADGDLMYAPGVLWTAAHHKVPLLSVMHNNRAYHQEVMHIQRLGNRRQRGVHGQAKIGTVFEDPFIDYSALAKSMGMWATGPITNPDDLGPALKKAVEVVDQGEPALVDVVCQPR